MGEEVYPMDERQHEHEDAMNQQSGKRRRNEEGGSAVGVLHASLSKIHTQMYFSFLKRAKKKQVHDTILSFLTVERKTLGWDTHKSKGLREENLKGQMPKFPDESYL